MELSVEEFIIKYKNRWINYCEIIILPDGKIVIASPSHIECALRLTKESREVIDKKMPIWASPIHWFINYLDIVSVWYDYQLLSENVTIEQNKTLETLSEEKMIKLNKFLIEES